MAAAFAVKLAGSSEKRAGIRRTNLSAARGLKAVYARFVTSSDSEEDRVDSRWDDESVVSPTLQVLNVTGEEQVYERYDFTGRPKPPAQTRDRSWRLFTRRDTIQGRAIGEDAQEFLALTKSCEAETLQFLEFYSLPPRYLYPLDNLPHRDVSPEVGSFNREEERQRLLKDIKVPTEVTESKPREVEVELNVMMDRDFDNLLLSSSSASSPSLDWPEDRIRASHRTETESERVSDIADDDEISVTQLLTRLNSMLEDSGSDDLQSHLQQRYRSESPETDDLPIDEHRRRTLAILNGRSISYPGEQGNSEYGQAGPSGKSSGYDIEEPRSQTAVKYNGKGRAVVLAHESDLKAATPADLLKDQVRQQNFLLASLLIAVKEISGFLDFVVVFMRCDSWNDNIPSEMPWDYINNDGFNREALLFMMMFFAPQGIDERIERQYNKRLHSTMISMCPASKNWVLENGNLLPDIFNKLWYGPIHDALTSRVPGWDEENPPEGWMSVAEEANRYRLKFHEERKDWLDEATQSMIDNGFLRYLSHGTLVRVAENAEQSNFGNTLSGTDINGNCFKYQNWDRDWNASKVNPFARYLRPKQSATQ